jgi:hypothetical protein
MPWIQVSAAPGTFSVVNLKVRGGASLAPAVIANASARVNENSSILVVFIEDCLLGKSAVVGITGHRGIEF